MADKFKKYVIRLHEDDAELVRFKKDPEGCISAAGLTREQGGALKSKDQAKIEAELNAEAGAAQPTGGIQHPSPTGTASGGGIQHPGAAAPEPVAKIQHGGIQIQALLAKLKR
jgi:hypothetical protein